jgi:enoyl-CoA hydratase/carnithine racemase
MGLANRVVAAEQLIPEAYALAARLANGPTYALGMTKLMVNNEWTMEIHSALEAEAQAQALMMMGEDHRAFYEAFAAKQKPVFRGK